MIGFLGGTFDPVHLGHLHAASQAVSQLALDSLHLVLSARPPHRGAPRASIEHRWAMLQLAAAGLERIEADDREIRRAPGPSYTVATLEEIRREVGAHRSVIWLIGWDQYRELAGWYQWDRLPTLAHLGVLRRPGQEGALSAGLETFTAQRRTRELARLRREPSGLVWFLQAEMLPISASEIRHRLAANEPVDGLLPAAVASYISDQHLYDGGLPI